MGLDVVCMISLGQSSYAPREIIISNEPFQVYFEAIFTKVVVIMAFQTCYTTAKKYIETTPFCCLCSSLLYVVIGGLDLVVEVVVDIEAVLQVSLF